MNFFWRRCFGRWAVLTVVMAVVQMKTAVRAESFGIKFLGNTTDNVTGTAGVLPMAGWTNLANAAFTAGTIHSSDGSVAVTLTRSGPGLANVWNSGATADGANGSLLDGYDDAQRNSPVTNVISGLTGSNYTVILYTAGDTARPSNNGDWLPNYTVNGVAYYTATLTGQGAFPGFTGGGVTQTNNHTYPTPLTSGNYIEIDNVAPVGGMITISANSDNRSWRSPLNGLEIVGETTADIAIAAYDAAFLFQSNGLAYYKSSLTNASPDGFWVQALDIQGLEDAYERTQSPHQRQLINTLLNTFLSQNPEPWSWDGYNDDLGWVSLVLARGYQMTGNASLLNAAEYGFNYAFARGWDTNYNGGGIWEQQPAYSGSSTLAKTPLANDSLASVACLLYQSTSNATYLAQAQQIYGWVRTNLFNANTGLVYEEVDTNGSVNLSPAVYNQGTFVDLANYLHQITGKTEYYDDALNAVEYTRNNLTDNAMFSNGAAYLNTWAAELARGLGHFVKSNDLWSTYYPWMLANANAAWGCRRTDLNIAWNAWTEPTPLTNTLTTSWCVSAVAMLQVTPTNEPGLVNCTNQLTGTIIGTTGSYGNSGNTIAKVFDGNIATFFDAPVATGAWAGLDFGDVSNVIGQINYWPRTGFASRMLGGVFQADNSPFFPNPVTLFTIVTAPPDTNVVTSRTITNRAAFRCVRYVGPTNGWCDVAEVQFFAPNPPPAPVYLTASVVPGVPDSLSLNWPGGGILLQATNLAGPWTTNAAATPPYLVTPTQPQQFYRVQF